MGIARYHVCTYEQAEVYRAIHDKMFLKERNNNTLLCVEPCEYE